MRDDIKRIMQMVEDGKISSGEATELIEALNVNDSEPTDERKSTEPYRKPSLKIRIKDADKERVRLNIPLRFVKWLLKTGHGIATAIPEAKPYTDDIDLNQIMQAIDKHETGKIIDVTNEKGEEVAIYIE